MNSNKFASRTHPTVAQNTIEGWQTQFPEATGSETEVIIGLDFGTAFTKVVAYIGSADRRYAVPLNASKRGADAYLLPTRLYEDAAGNLTLSESLQPHATHPIHENFKMDILYDRLDATTRNHIVTYLALVLQKTRQWLLTEKRDVLPEQRIAWVVNVGMPTEKYDDKLLKEKYCQIVQDAWSESTRSPNRPTNEDNNVEINAFPEFVAQIQGYIASSKRKHGVHALVDVGHGTVDATVFNVWQEDQKDVHSIWSRSVRRLGVGVYKEFCYNKATLDESDTAIKEFETSLRSQINYVLQEAHSKTCMDREWDTRIPFMLCGGGARKRFYSKFYQEIVNNKEGYFAKTTHARKLEFEDFPLLRNMDEDAFNLEATSLPDGDFDRLSVAYGLSFYELGKIIPYTP